MLNSKRRVEILTVGLAGVVLVSAMSCGQSTDTICQAAADRVATCLGNEPMQVSSCDPSRADEILQKECTEINASVRGGKADWASDWALACYFCGMYKLDKYCSVCFQYGPKVDQRAPQFDAGVSASDVRKDDTSKLDIAALRADRGPVEEDALLPPIEAGL